MMHTVQTLLRNPQRVSFLILLYLGVAQFAYADDGPQENNGLQPNPDRQTDQTRFSPDQGKTVRHALFGILDSYERLSRLTGYPGLEEQTNAARELLLSMSDGEAAIFTPILPAFQEWRRSAETHSQELIRRFESQTQRNETHAAGTATDPYPQPSFYTTFPCTPDALSPGDKIISVAAVVAGEVAKEVASRICHEDVSGFNGSAACIATDALWFILKNIWETEKLCAEFRHVAEVQAAYAGAKHVHGDIAALSATLDDIRAGVDSLDVLDSVILLEDEEILRHLIEANLQGHGAHPHALGAYQLPASQGGHLDSARVIVAELIETWKQIGANVSAAEHLLEQGDLEYTDGRFKRAYLHYSEAYLELTRTRTTDPELQPSP